MVKHARPIGAVAAALALALGLTACGADAAEAPQDDAAPDAASDATAQDSPAPDAAAQDDGAAPSESEAPADEPGAGPLTVTAEGDGPIGLTTGDAPAGTAQSFDGRLITGPGDCFAYKDRDRPQLLVFPADAEFVTSGERPSVTAEALGTAYAGERIQVSAVEVPQDEIDGIPEQCAAGAADSVLVVVS